MTCTTCQTTGHNKSGCPRKSAQETQNSGPSNSTGQTSGTQGRGRGVRGSGPSTRGRGFSTRGRGLGARGLAPLQKPTKNSSQVNIDLGFKAPGLKWKDKDAVTTRQLQQKRDIMQMNLSRKSVEDNCNPSGGVTRNN